MFNAQLFKQRSSVDNSKEKLRLVRRKRIMEVAHARSLSRIDQFVTKMRASSSPEDKLSGFYVSGNPNLHSHREIDPCLPTNLKLTE